MKIRRVNKKQLIKASPDALIRFAKYLEIEVLSNDINYIYNELIDKIDDKIIGQYLYDGKGKYL